VVEASTRRGGGKERGDKPRVARLEGLLEWAWVGRSRASVVGERWFRFVCRGINRSREEVWRT